MTGLTRQTHRSAHGQVAELVRLTRPNRRNALDLATVEALLEAMRADPQQPVVLGSATPGIFCAGADLGVSAEERAEASDRLYECYEVMVRRPGLVVAVVDGAAVGGGAQLTTAADVRIAGPNARWRWVGPAHGLAVGAWILPDLLGRSRALDLALTGRWLELEEARQSGFVHRVVADPWVAATELLDQLARAHPDALGRVKEIATRPETLRALTRERRQNREAWDGRAPAPPGRRPGATLDGSD